MRTGAASGGRASRPVVLARRCPGNRATARRPVCYGGASRRAMADFNERDFYLDEFRGHTLVVALPRGALARAAARRQLRAVVRDLVAHGVRVLIVIGDAVGSPAAERRRLGVPAVRPRRGVRRVARRGDTVLWRASAPEESLAEVWQVLRARSLAIAVCAETAPVVACRVAERFRVHKLVVVDPTGGLLERGSRRPISFLDESAL